MFATGKCIAAGLALTSASMVLASNELQIDVNSLRVQVMDNGFTGPTASDSTGFALGDAVTRGGAFGTTFTGSISMADDATSNLAGLLCDGVPLLSTGSLFDFTGQIDFVGGVVNGGSFTVTVLESDLVTMNSYTASIAQGVGQINTQAGQGFSIDGLTFAGMFSSSIFSGVDVSRWDDAEPLFGSFIQFQFNPNANGVDDETDIDIFVVVPLPTAPALAGVGLAGMLLGVRRRRLA